MHNSSPRKPLLLLASALLVFACFPLESTAKKMSTKEAVTSTLQKQADAWNRGDLDTFMTGYQVSEDTSYVSGDTEVKGYSALRDRYAHKYGDNKETMGKLTFANLKVTELGHNNALCVGHWHLECSSASSLDGIFSLVLARTSAGWKIIHDHTSVAKKST